MFLYIYHFGACTYHILGRCSAFPLQKYYNFADCTNLPLFFSTLLYLHIIFRAIEAKTKKKIQLEDKVVSNLFFNFAHY